MRLLIYYVTETGDKSSFIEPHCIEMAENHKHLLITHGDMFKSKRRHKTKNINFEIL